VHHDYDFLIVGGGMTADAAARGIRQRGSRGSIGIIGEERTAPFPRPALSKKLWSDPELDGEVSVFDTSAGTGAVLHLGERAVSLDTTSCCVLTGSGDTFGYRRLLLATGGRPCRVDGLAPSDRTFYFRTLDDYQRLRALAAGEPDVVVVGGSGYIGSEIACALVQHGCSVTLVHPEEVLGSRQFPVELAQYYESLFTGAGVRVAGGVSVTSGSEDDEAVTLHLSDGSVLRAQVVVVGLGMEPAGDLAGDTVRRSADGGIAVDDRLMTSVGGVFAAGDVAEYPDRILGRTRVEHVDGAIRMGRAVGRIMAGSEETYDHTPCFYSDVFDVGFEAVGTLDPSMQTIQDPVEDDGLVVYYVDEAEVRGVLLWNLDGGLDQARELLARHERPRDPVDLVGSVR
jgi:3-phenylpropionate/trans-cinnamate dioxygenase ferredoxin reductase subunit